MMNEIQFGTAFDEEVEETQEAVEEEESQPVLGSTVMRTETTGVRLISDAAVVLPGRPDVVLMVSGAGPESSVKAIAAGLRSNARVQFVIDQPGMYSSDPKRHEEGYRVYTARIDGNYNYWHILLVADVPGFLPILSDDSLWQDISSDRFTTPVLREWMPWLREQMENSWPKMLVNLKQSGCNAGMLIATTEDLDGLVQSGLESGDLTIPEGGDT
jgi:hypothetical protein